MGHQLTADTQKADSLYALFVAHYGLLGLDYIGDIYGAAQGYELPASMYSLNGQGYRNDLGQFQTTSIGLCQHLCAVRGGEYPAAGGRFLDFSGMLNCRLICGQIPQLIWQTETLKEVFHLFYAALITDGKPTLKVYKNCGKVYYNSHAKSEFCGTKCRNYYNVKAFQGKQLDREESSFSPIWVCFTRKDFDIIEMVYRLIVVKLGKEAAMDTIITQSKGSNLVKVKDKFIPNETERTRTVFKAVMYSGGIRRDIIRYRKDSGRTCEELISVNFSSLYPDDGIEITLPINVIRTLFRKLKELEVTLQKHGIHYETHDLTIVDVSTLVASSKGKAIIIRKLLEVSLGGEMWNQPTQNSPDIATRLAVAKFHEDGIISPRTSEQMPSNERLTEND